jgi:predicted  nucleic acid-binding Zn-ribbon protein
MPPKDESVVGRTTADATVDIFRLLWTSAPWLLIVAGAVFAMYMFREQSRESDDKVREAMQKAQEQYEKSLIDTRQALLEAYTQIGAVNKQQIENVRELLTAQDEVTKKLNDQRAQLDKLEESLREQQAQVEQAQVEADSAKARRDALQNEIASIQRQVEENRTKLAALAHELEGKKAGLSQGAANIDTMRNELQKLASTLIREADAQTRPDESLGIAHRVLTEVLQDLGEILRAFAESQTDSTRSALGSLIGVDETRLTELLRGGHGYDFWIRLNFPADATTTSPASAHFIGADQSESADAPVVIIETDKGRVVSVDSLSAGFAVRMPDDAEWDRAIGVVIDSGYGSAETFPLRADQATWSIAADVVPMLGGVTAEILFGKEKPLELLTIDSFQERYPEDFRILTEGKQASSGPALSIQMYLNAKGFDAARLEGVDRIGPPELRHALLQLIDASVKGERDKAIGLLDGAVDRGVVGRLAAAALRPHFSIISVDQFTDRGGRDVASILARISDPEDEFLVERRIEFRRGSNQSTWLLTRFEESVSTPTMQAGTKG